MTIADNVLAVERLLRAYESKYHRPFNAVQLMIVGKGRSPEALIKAWEAGARAFGENYLQEALLKIARFKKEGREATWHYIGRLQSNKTRKIAAHFDWVHTVSNETLARRLHESRPPDLPPLNICIQINTSGELTKSGIDQQALIPLLQYCMSLPRLCVRGLMCLPAPTTDFEAQRSAFHELAALFHELHHPYPTLDTLSMGTSTDAEAAIAEGATIVRIGTKVFERSAD